MRAVTSDNADEHGPPPHAVTPNDREPAKAPTSGVGSPGAQRRSRRGVSVLRRRPPAPLNRLVDRIWHVSWALENGQQVAPEVVIQPAVTLTFEQGTAMITGLGSLRFRRELVGRGRALGVVFRPGCFRPLLGRSVQTIHEQSLPAHEIFGPSMLQLQSALSQPQPIDRQIQLVCDYFAPMIPPERTLSEAVAELVHYMVTEPAIGGVGDVSRQLGLGRRRLNRILTDHVGVGPKWIMERRHLPQSTPSHGTASPRWGELARELAHHS